MKQYDITIESGADFYFPHRLKDDSGNLINLTGATVSAQLREYPEALDAFDFTCSHNGLGGQVILTMPHEATAQIGYTAGYYDVFVDYPDETREKVLWGTVTIQPNVTKPIAGTPMVLLSFTAEEDFPSVGIITRMYFSHASSKFYRWNGTAYVGIQINATWETLEGKPDVFPPDSHQHDDRYFTEAETTTLLSGKANVGDSYTKAESDTLLSAKANSADVYTKSATDALLSKKADIIHTSASGAIAVIHDAAAGNVDSLTVGIEPVQDLHGQSAPYPAGGGKNLLPLTLADIKTGNTGGTWTGDSYALNGVTFTFDTQDGYVTAIKCSGNASATTVFDCTKKWQGTSGTQYTLSGCPSGGQDGSKYKLDHYYSNDPVAYAVDTGSGVSFTENSQDFNKLIRIVIYSGYGNGLTFKPMIRLSSVSDAAFAPYSNVCPISGHSTATVTRTGANLANVANAVSTSNVSLSVSETDTGSVIVGETLGTYTYQDIHIDIPMAGLEGQTITMSGKQTISGGAIYSAQFRAFKNGVITILASNPSTESINISCVIPDCDFMRLHFGVVSDTGVAGAKKTLTNIMVNIGGTALPWQKFSSQQVTIDLNGERFGGTVDDVKTGVMPVDRVMHTFDGSNDEGWQVHGSIASWFYSDVLIDAYKSNNNADFAITNAYRQRKYDEVTSLVNGEFSIGSPSGQNLMRFIVKDTRFTTVAEFTTNLASNNLQVCYTLATPQTVQLTPAELSLLYGTNNVWADTGDVSVGYRADTKLYIDRKIAELQALILDN